MSQWSPAGAICAARMATGLGMEEVAQRLGPSLAWYEELEGDDAAAFTNISLAHLTVLAALLQTSPRELLLGPTAPQAESLTFTALAAALQEHAETHVMSVDELSARVGWPLSDALIDPEDFWNITVDGLRSVCAEVGMDWVALLSGGLPIMRSPTYE